MQFISENLIMRKTNFAILLTLFALQIAAGQSSTDFNDFSKKGTDYKPLENLRFATDDVIYSGSESVKILGRSHAASKFSLTAKTNVQTLSALGEGKEVQVYERKSANFEVLVIEDKNKTIHNIFVQTMYDIWSKKELYSGECFFDFNTKGNEYILTAMPDLVNVKGFYYIWVNGRVIKIIFKGFQKESGGWGVMDSFTSDNLRVNIAETEVKAYQFRLSPRKSFLKMYKAGSFNLPKTEWQFNGGRRQTQL